jgi:hypothetical protein
VFSATKNEHFSPKITHFITFFATFRPKNNFYVTIRPLIFDLLAHLGQKIPTPRQKKVTFDP